MIIADLVQQLVVKKGFIDSELILGICEELVYGFEGIGG